jgi:hypothetical protein
VVELCLVILERRLQTTDIFRTLKTLTRRQVLLVLADRKQSVDADKSPSEYRVFKKWERRFSRWGNWNRNQPVDFRAITYPTTIVETPTVRQAIGRYRAGGFATHRDLGELVTSADQGRRVVPPEAPVTETESTSPAVSITLQRYAANEAKTNTEFFENHVRQNGNRLRNTISKTVSGTELAVVVATPTEGWSIYRNTARICSAGGDNLEDLIPIDQYSFKLVVANTL